MGLARVRVVHRGRIRVRVRVRVRDRDRVRLRVKGQLLTKNRFFFLKTRSKSTFSPNAALSLMLNLRSSPKP